MECFNESAGVFRLAQAVETLAERDPKAFQHLLFHTNFKPLQVLNLLQLNWVRSVNKRKYDTLHKVGLLQQFVATKGMFFPDESGVSPLQIHVPNVLSETAFTKHFPNAHCRPIQVTNLSTATATHAVLRSATVFIPVSPWKQATSATSCWTLPLSTSVRVS